VSDEKPIGNSEWLGEFNLLLEDRVNCDSAQCLNEAVFFSKTNCCESVMLACTPCMIEAGKSLELMIKRQDGIKCSNCNKVVPARGWLSIPNRLALDTTN